MQTTCKSAISKVPAGAWICAARIPAAEQFSWNLRCLTDPCTIGNLYYLVKHIIRVASCMGLLSASIIACWRARRLFYNFCGFIRIRRLKPELYSSFGIFATSRACIRPAGRAAYNIGRAVYNSKSRPSNSSYDTRSPLQDMPRIIGFSF